MSYKHHKTFAAPPPDAHLWRYLDFAKFLALLESRSLFFASSDRLGDPFEGTYPARNLKRDNVVWPNMPAAERGKAEEWAAAEKVRSKAERRYFCINCWHESECESDAMWKIYSAHSAGIAIQTTFARLCESMEGHTGDEIYAGRVTYIDYAKTFMPEGNGFNVFLHKRIAFAHEREVRAIVWARHDDADASTPRAGVVDGGVSVKIVPATLIRDIVLSPLAQPWFHRLVDDILIRYNIPLRARHSQLADEIPY